VRPPEEGTWKMETETRLSADEIERSLGISRQELDELIALGLAEPAAPGASEFTVATVVRLRRVSRLHADLEVDFLGAAIIVDLMERLDRLEAEIRAIRSGRST
jgi:chaperone modulatory protein CbpM